MQVAVTTSRRTVEYHTAPDPHAHPGTAVVRIHAVTLCGTDLHIWDDDYATELPIVQGHEGAGVIESLDQADAGGDWSVGDRVAISPMFYCGTCYACRIGRINACRQMSVYGCYEDGLLATLCEIPLEKLYRVPDSLDLGLAPMSEPQSIAMQAVRRGRASADDTVLVSGAGPIGLLATLYLKSIGSDVTVCDLDADRLELAERMGADRMMVVAPESFPDAHQRAVLDELTNGDGPSLVIDATGAPRSIATGIELVASAGRVVCVGISDAEVRMSVRQLPVKELDILGSRNSDNLIGASLALVDEHQDAVETIITHRFAFDDLDRAFETLADPNIAVGKIAIDFPVAQDRA